MLFRSDVCSSDLGIVTTANESTVTSARHVASSSRLGEALNLLATEALLAVLKTSKGELLVLVLALSETSFDVSVWGSGSESCQCSGLAGSRLVSPATVVDPFVTLVDVLLWVLAWSWAVRVAVGLATVGASTGGRCIRRTGVSGVSSLGEVHGFSVAVAVAVGVAVAVAVAVLATGGRCVRRTSVSGVSSLGEVLHRSRVPDDVAVLIDDRCTRRPGVSGISSLGEVHELNAL